MGSGPRKLRSKNGGDLHLLRFGGWCGLSRLGGSPLKIALVSTSIAGTPLVSGHRPDMKRGKQKARGNAPQKEPEN